MDDKTFKAWMKLIDAETVEELGDAKFAVEVAKIAKKKELVHITSPVLEWIIRASK